MLILHTIRIRCCIGNKTNIVASYEYKLYIDGIQVCWILAYNGNGVAIKAPLSVLNYFGNCKSKHHFGLVKA